MPGAKLLQGCDRNVRRYGFEQTTEYRLRLQPDGQLTAAEENAWEHLVVGQQNASGNAYSRGVLRVPGSNRASTGKPVCFSASAYVSYVLFRKARVCRLCVASPLCRYLTSKCSR